ncbi:MAG TPA: type I restriction enzyme HsdR N-terminal domain-containing protein [Candidatus Kapabacteria bacterium]|nr:type I restriction enzyme HsdR N-terminal domain-containing protein [Candidatus Kapabacteria bacterium]
MDTIKLAKLNLPSYKFTFKSIEGKLYILDEIRSQYVFLTPEEWVRQNLVMYLITHQKYPKSFFSLESSINSKNSKRCDIIIYNKDMSAFMLIECKNSKIKINEKVLIQSSKYNLIVKAKYMVISNGLNHYIFEANYKNNGFMQLDNFPLY